MTKGNNHQIEPWRPSISPCETNNQATLDPFVQGRVKIFTHDLKWKAYSRLSHLSIERSRVFPISMPLHFRKKCDRSILVRPPTCGLSRGHGEALMDHDNRAITVPIRRFMDAYVQGSGTNNDARLLFTLKPTENMYDRRNSEQTC